MPRPTLALLIALVPATALAQSPSGTTNDLSGVMVHGEYGLGRNLSPSQGSVADAYVSNVVIDGGLGVLKALSGDGVAFGGELSAVIGHNDGTTRDLLGGGFVRFAHAGFYGKLAFEHGFIRGAMDARTELAALELGISAPVGVWAPSLGVGAQLGETRDDGFVAIITVTIGCDRYLSF
jgi:hypothetical protein